MSLHTVDVAHPPMPPDQVEAALLDAVGVVRNAPALRVLKIIHGHGSSGRGGSTKDVVRNWLFRQRSRVREVIEGEKYDLFDSATREMRAEAGNYADPDLGNANPGITIVWVK